MDCIQYVNSKDIRQYLYNIDYHLSFEQMIFLIRNCSFISVNKKIEELLSLKEHNENTILSCVRNDLYYAELSGISAYEFIDGSVNYLKSQIQALKETNEDYFYQVELLLNDDMSYLPYKYYKTYQQCLEAIQINTRLLEKSHCFKISKFKFSEATVEECILSNDFQIMALESYSTPCPFDENAQQISLPIPFKKGDLVKINFYPYPSMNYSLLSSFKFVFYGYKTDDVNKTEQDSRENDIPLFGHFCDDDFFLMEGKPCKFNLEYMTPDLSVHEDRKLSLISQYIKGKIDLANLYSESRYLDDKNRLNSKKNRDTVLHEVYY